MTTCTNAVLSRWAKIVVMIENCQVAKLAKSASYYDYFLDKSFFCLLHTYQEEEKEDHDTTTCMYTSTCIFDPVESNYRHGSGGHKVST